LSLNRRRRPLRQLQRSRITEVGRVYWYPDYQVCDEIEEIRAHLVLVFQGVE
jgi:hypothetical protein